MRSIVLAVGTLGVLMAGCLVDEAPAPGTDAPIAPDLTGPMSLAWGVADCKIAVGIMGAEAAKLAPYMPKGFRALAPQEMVNGAAPNLKGDANIGVEGFVCKEGVGLNGTVPDLFYGSVFSMVAAPAQELRAPGAGFYFVKWDVLIPDEDRRALLASRGVPAREGSVSFARHTIQGSVNAFDASVKIDQAGEFRIVGEGFAPMEPGAFREFTQTPDGLAVYTTKYKGAVAQGSSLVTVPANAWVAKVTGAGTFPALTFSGVGTFFDGTIELPAKAAS